MMSYTAWYLARIYICAAFDLTGRFPQRFSQGNQYILVGYHFDENYITGIPLESRAAAVITEAWKKMHQEFLKLVWRPTFTLWTMNIFNSHFCHEG